VKGGDTFRLVGVADRHTWVVLSDPAQDPNCVLIVSFTSYIADTGMDNSCVVGPHEFSILTNKSVIYYEDVREASLASLQAIKNVGKLQNRTPVPETLLQRIREGAMVSAECKEKFKTMLIKQGVIPPASRADDTAEV
jgi:hypothetical protein